MAAEQPRGRDAVAAQVVQGPAAKGWRAADVAGRDVNAQGRPDGGQPADRPFGQQPAGQDGLGVVAPHEPLDHGPPAGLGGVEAAGRVRRAGRERLLAQHVLAGLEGADRPVGVQ
jgi:hypothetical protein